MKMEKRSRTSPALQFPGPSWKVSSLLVAGHDSRDVGYFLNDFNCSFSIKEGEFNTQSPTTFHFCLKADIYHPSGIHTGLKPDVALRLTCCKGWAKVPDCHYCKGGVFGYLVKYCRSVIM